MKEYVSCIFFGSTTIREFWMMELKGKGTKGTWCIFIAEHLS